MEKSPENSGGRERLRQWKTEAREKAKAYLQQKRACKTRQERKALREKYKASVGQWKGGLKALDKKERKDQRKAYKAFKRRKNRCRRISIWSVVIALLLCIAVALAPILSMAAGVLGSQKYITEGEAVDAARAAGYALSAEICDEGFILLKNDQGLLPLESGARLNVFGDDAYNFVYGGSGSAGASQTGVVSLFDALSQAGIAYNTELDGAYRALGLAPGGADGGLGGMLKAFFTGETDSSDWQQLEDAVIQQARDWSDTALIVLSSQEVEGAELQLSLLQPMKQSSAKAALIDRVCKDFEHVIFVINSGNAMELGFMEEYDSIDAAIWVGAPGALGCVELAKMLAGQINPSGRTVDTWPVSIENEPGYVNYGDNSYTNSSLHVFTYDEGIYVGYRYYETWFGLDAAEYAQQVVFPFGHGLSYTSFTQEIDDIQADDDSVNVQVTVTNTGDVAGKDVVQLYFMPPWYEASGIEKSAIELGAFAKTGELAPGESETLSLSYDSRDMASYSTLDGCYVLEKGEYKIAIGQNVHEALLSEDYYTYELERDILYTTDTATGADIQNLFAFSEGDIEYMSRSDMEGTFPQRHESYTLTDEMLSDMAVYEQADTDYTNGATQEPAYGVDTGLVLADMKGLDYDDPQWEQFLDGFTVDEMIQLLANAGWHTGQVERLGVPATHMLDGPSGINSMFASLEAVAYPMATVISSSWNTEMAQRLGQAIGDEANAYGVNFWYAPAMNIHRLSIGGRNSEYYSEDPMLSGKMAAATVEAIQDKGVVAMMKHFVCNDVELNARSDVSIWVSEQALREIYLLPFEIAVKEGGAAGAMTSFSRMGVEWCGGSDTLLQRLLRDEWGFEGVITTDACLGGWMSAELAIKNGNDLMLEMGLQNSVSVLEKAYEKDPVGMGWSLRNAAHNLCFAIVEYTGLCG